MEETMLASMADVGMGGSVPGQRRSGRANGRLPIPQRGCARLVIIEAGASAIPFEPAPPECEHTVVVVQSAGESLARLGRRVRARLLEMERARLMLTWAVLVLGSSFDGGAIGARLQIGRALRGHARSFGAGMVTLALHAPESLQPEVFQLLDALAFELAGEALSVHIRFDRAAAARWPQEWTESPRADGCLGCGNHAGWGLPE